MQVRVVAARQPRCATSGGDHPEISTPWEKRSQRFGARPENFISYPDSKANYVRLTSDVSTMDDGSVHLPAAFLSEMAIATTRQSLFDVAAQWLPEMTGAHRCAISEATATELRLLAGGGQTNLPSSDLVYPIKGSLVGAIFTSRRITRIHDLTELEGAEVQTVTGAGLRAAICAPLISASEAIGLLSVSHPTPGYFDDGHEMLVGAIADLLASFLNVHNQIRRAEHLARTDRLTGCLNRAAIVDALELAFESQAPPSVLYIDVDSFKPINDRHGHSVGDAVLCGVSSRIKSVLGDGSQIGRIGGDEFLVVVPEDADGSQAADLAKRTTATMTEPVRVGPLNVDVNLSIGAASVTSAKTTATDILHDADQAMYYAKWSQTRVAVANATIRRDAAVKAAIDNDIEEAAIDELFMTFQPVRHLGHGEILGAEALLRWNHPTLGTIAVPTIIERVEATGRIDSFTRWLVDTTVGDWRRVQDAVPWFHDKGTSVNFTPRQLSCPGLVDHLINTLDRLSVRRRDLIIEVVESAAIIPGGSAEETIHRLSEAGFIIALDDFGTGHNAVSYLTRLPIDALKFDQSLVATVTTQESARLILRNLATMAQDLGLVTLAEGIESERQAALVLDAGIEVGQGWHLGGPCLAEELIATALAEGPTLKVLTQFESAD